MFYVIAAKLDINIEKSICFRKVFVQSAKFSVSTSRVWCNRSSLVFGKVEEILITPLEKWKFVLKLRWKKEAVCLTER